MGHYKSNLRDLEFNLFEVFGRHEVLGRGPYADVDEANCAIGVALASTLRAAR